VREEVERRVENLPAASFGLQFLFHVKKTDQALGY
jgi:hypothetical protein